jgi:ABC-type multidrug transport system fused ATPase/permease subunit
MTSKDAQRHSARLSRQLYRYVWQTSRRRQVQISLLTMVMAPTVTIPLELQRRMLDDAIAQRDLRLLILLGSLYLLVVVLQGAMKYLLNMLKSSAVETIARDLRQRIVRRVTGTDDGERSGEPKLNSGEIVSMLAAETEDISGFGGECFGLPLLSAGTIVYVIGYLIWIQPVIAILAFIVYFPQAIIVPLTQHTINRLARLRIQEVRNLGHFAVRAGHGQLDHEHSPKGRVFIDRIYRLRIRIYLRKYFLAALGNFLDSMGPLLVLIVGGALVILGKTEVGTLVVFISGLSRVADPWDQLVNFYRSVSNTAIAYDMIHRRVSMGRAA